MQMAQNKANWVVLQRKFLIMNIIRLRFQHSEPVVVQELIHSILRVPGVLTLELFLRNHDSNGNRPMFHEKLQNEFLSWLEYMELPQLIKSRNFNTVLEAVLTCSAVMFGMMVIFLPANKLISLYLHLVSFVLLGTGYYLSYQYVQNEQFSTPEDVVLDDFAKLERHGFHFLCQLLFAVVVSCLLSVRNDFARCGLTICALPIVARICGFPVEKLHLVLNFSCCFLMVIVCVYVLNCVPSVLQIFRNAENWLKLSFYNNGYTRTAVEIWKYTKLPILLALFWCVLCITEIYTSKNSQTESSVIPLTTTTSLSFMGSLKKLCAQTLYCCANCCTTWLSLFGFASATFYFSYFSILLTKLFLKGGVFTGGVLHIHVEEADLPNSGYAESLTLLILALQTDLVNKNVEHKAFVICILLFIVLSSLLQSIFDVVEPALLQIGASQNTDFWRHFRALILCSALFVVPIVLSISISILLPVDVWLLIIISSCVLISVQTIGSIVIYALFLYDMKRSQGSWDRLDDFVYYCRAIIRMMEFLVAFSVIAYGVWESIFGEWSWMNSSILIVHCYFNVWLRLQAGWQSFLLRRDAAKKLEMLPKACKRQLEDTHDVCSICYQEMNEARVTPCNHFFHGACLKKWLYVKQSCPMCHYDLNFKTRSSLNVSGNNSNVHAAGSRDDQNDEEGYSSEEQSAANFDTGTEDGTDQNDD